MPKIVVISTNAGTRMGGEAIKAYQFFQYLLDQGRDAILCTHARCRDEIAGVFPADRVIFVEDDAVFEALWKSKVGAGLLTLYFHSRVKKVLLNRGLGDAIWHFLCPISPVEPRMFPRSAHVVIGPLNGNLTYPPGFHHRVGKRSRMFAKVYRPVQKLLAGVFGDKKRAHVVLNSGGQRTADALRWAGVPQDRIVPVLDSGLTRDFTMRPVTRHDAPNARFVMLGRFVDYKGYDLAIDAVAQAQGEIILDIYGDGEGRAALEARIDRLGLQDRVRIKGWISHEALLREIGTYRGFVFPTLAEANGIVMQEMMCLGIPVICLNWGGPAMLAQPGEAVMIEPESPAQVIAELAQAMDRLADDPAHADEIAQRAHAHAVDAFAWDRVAASWTASYDQAGRS